MGQDKQIEYDCLGCKVVTVGMCLGTSAHLFIRARSYPLSAKPAMWLMSAGAAYAGVAYGGRFWPFDKSKTAENAKNKS